jgi:hypothetical protein
LDGGSVHRKAAYNKTTKIILFREGTIVYSVDTACRLYIWRINAFIFNAAENTG